MPTQETRRAIDEKEFETAYNFEFLREYGGDLTAFPYIPTTIDEATKGYDIHYALTGSGMQVVDYFLQFKKAIWHGNKRRMCISYPFTDTNLYSFDLHRGSPPRFYTQHNCLVEQVRNVREKEVKVYYVAPTFHLRADLFVLFSRGMVMENSVAFKPDEIGKLSEIQPIYHRVYYTRSDNFGIFCSEEKELKMTNTKLIVKESKPVLFNEEYVTRIFKELTFMITGDDQKDAPEIPEKFQNYGLITKAAYLARFYLGLEWYIIPYERLKKQDDQDFKEVI